MGALAVFCLSGHLILIGGSADLLAQQRQKTLQHGGRIIAAPGQATPLEETGLASRRDNPSAVLQGFLALLRKQIGAAAD